MKRVDRYKAALDAVRPFGGDTLRELRDYYKKGILSLLSPDNDISPR